MTPKAAGYNIVVLGAMNPLLHSPGWYRLVELISEDEMQEAVGAATTVCIPPVAQFECNQLKITCQPQRWEVHTTSFDRTDRIVEIAGRVFDDLLNQTPISSFGLNFIFSFDIGKDAAKAVADRIKNSGLDFNWKNALAAELNIVIDQNDHREAVKITQDESVVQFSNNFHYDIIPTSDSPKHFSLRDRINKVYGGSSEKALQTSMDCIDVISR